MRGFATWATVLGTWATVLVALLAVLKTSSDVRETLRQDSRIARDQIAAEGERALAQANEAFILAAAQIVMAEPNCPRALKRARILQALFPERLPSDFAEPVALAIGRYRFNFAKRLAIPLPDPSGCTNPKPVKMTAATTELVRQLQKKPFSPFSPRAPRPWLPQSPFYGQRQPSTFP